MPGSPASASTSAPARAVSPRARARRHLPYRGGQMIRTFYVRPESSAAMARATARATRTPGTASSRWTGRRSPAQPATLWVCGEPGGPGGFVTLHVEWSYLNNNATTVDEIEIPARPHPRREPPVARSTGACGRRRARCATPATPCRSSARRARATRRSSRPSTASHIYRYDLPTEADGALGYALEYSAALFWTFVLSLKVLFGRAASTSIHACNPPDLFFLIGGFYKLFGKKFLFDHHDINPGAVRGEVRPRAISSTEADGAGSSG